MNNSNDTLFTAEKSVFTGGLLSYVFIRAFTILLTFLTFGLAHPWSICIMEKWVCEHTYINGRQLRFIGTGGDLILRWLTWFFLTIITFGIYSFWFNIKVLQWKTENTVFM